MNDVDPYEVRRLALVLSVQAEIEGMKVANFVRKTNREAPAYNIESFQEKASELQNLAYCHGEQL